ncbi:basic proline-rich protein-like [Pan paniscus]|uniref:basic proline-rich protein-like n=1 Tax=Pan paniscus TaxID=9597 RepID=UPI003003EE00
MARLEELSGGKGSGKTGYNTLERLEPPTGPKGAATPSGTRPSERRSPAPALQRAQHPARPRTARPERVLRPAHRSPAVPAGRPHPGAAPSSRVGRIRPLRIPARSTRSRCSSWGRDDVSPTASAAGAADPPAAPADPAPAQPLGISPAPRSRPSPSPASPFRPRLLPLLVPSASSDANRRLHHLLPRTVPPNPPLSLQSPLFPSGAPARADGESPQPGAETERRLSRGCRILPGPVWQCWKKRRGEKAASPDESARPVEKLRCGHPLSWRWAAGPAALWNSGQIPREQRPSWPLHPPEALRGRGAALSNPQPMWDTPYSGLDCWEHLSGTCSGY